MLKIPSTNQMTGNQKRRQRAHENIRTRNGQKLFFGGILCLFRKLRNNSFLSSKRHVEIFLQLQKCNNKWYSTSFGYKFLF